MKMNYVQWRINVEIWYLMYGPYRWDFKITFWITLCNHHSNRKRKYQKLFAYPMWDRPSQVDMKTSSLHENLISEMRFKWDRIVAQVSHSQTMNTKWNRKCHFILFIILLVWLWTGNGNIYSKKKCIIKWIRLKS